MVWKFFIWRLRVKVCHWSWKPNSSISKASKMPGVKKIRRNIYTPFSEGMLRHLVYFKSDYLYLDIYIIYLSISFFLCAPPCIIYPRYFSCHPIHRKRSKERNWLIITKPNKPQSCWSMKLPTISILKLEANRPLRVILGSIKPRRIVLS